jgi:hypothetical protein
MDVRAVVAKIDLINNSIKALYDDKRVDEDLGDTVIDLLQEYRDYLYNMPIRMQGEKHE